MSNDSGFDFTDLDTKTAADAGTVVHLEHPGTGDPLYDEKQNPITITVLGSDSEKVRKLVRQQADKRFERMRRQKEGVTSAAIESDAVARMVAATVAWQGVKLDGQVLECNEQNARKLYGDPRFPWIAEQVEKAIEDRQRFFKSASQS